MKVIKLIEITNDDGKRQITKDILQDLPLWFGLEESTKTYIETVSSYPFIAAYINDKAVGFYSLRQENDKVLDLYVLGVLKQYHHQGIGSLLQKYAETYAKNNGYQYLMVITLAKKANNFEYNVTRKFYLKNGFFDLYQSDDLFDKNNPAQILVKKL